jgi:AcrR family transcriptional regulator
VNAIDTKSKIIAVAQELFGEKGFDGASVREIAQKADVNISAINYHFQNKENLYFSVMHEAHLWLAEEMKVMSESKETTSDFIWSCFLFLHKNSRALRSAFMMMLSDSFPKMDEERHKEMFGNKEMGPPGGEYLFDVIKKEVGDEVDSELIKWAVKTLFSDIIHFALMMSGEYCKVCFSDHPDFSLESRKKSFEMHTEAILSYLKAKQ